MFRAQGAELATTYLNARAEPHVRPLVEQLACPIVVPCDVRLQGQPEDVFTLVAHEWGRLDFLLHSIAYAPKEDLRSRVVDCRRGRHDGHRRLLPLVHPHGEIGRAPHDRRRMPPYGDVLRIGEGGRGIQSDGSGQGGARELRPLPRCRTGREAHSCPCPVAGTAEDARRVRHRPVRRTSGAHPRPHASSWTSRTWETSRPFSRATRPNHSSAISNIDAGYHVLA